MPARQPGALLPREQGSSASGRGGRTAAQSSTRSRTTSARRSAACIKALLLSPAGSGDIEVSPRLAPVRPRRGARVLKQHARRLAFLSDAAVPSRRRFCLAAIDSEHRDSPDSWSRDDVVEPDDAGLRCVWRSTPAPDRRRELPSAACSSELSLGDRTCRSRKVLSRSWATRPFGTHDHEGQRRDDQEEPSVKGSSSAVKFWIAPTSKRMTTSQALRSAKRATADGMCSRQ